MNNLNKEIENRGFNVGDRVELGYDDDRIWIICDVYPNPDDLDPDDLEPGDGLSTGALRYDVATFENGDRNYFEVMSIDHNEIVNFHSKATADSLKFVEEVHDEYK